MAATFLGQEHSNTLQEVNLWAPKSWKIVRFLEYVDGTILANTRLSEEVIASRRE
jgi:hypothetical protein